LALGQKLWRSVANKDADIQSLVMANFQLHLGGSLLSQEEKNIVASNFLLLGRRASVVVGFKVYSLLLERGINLLAEDHWVREPELSLALYNTLAEVKYTMGDFDRVTVLVNEILEHARCLDDKLHAHSTQVYMLIAQDRMNEAIDIGLGVLGELGEHLPCNPTSSQVKVSYLYMDFLLRGKSNESLLRLPMMEDTRRVVVMQMLNLLFTSALFSRPFLAPIIATIMVQTTLKHGLCAISSTAFAVYGMLLCSYALRGRAGHRYGQVALRLLESLHGSLWLHLELDLAD
jgi:predicted ATPase